MKKKNISYKIGRGAQPMELKDAAPAYSVQEEPMIRTQIYLSRAEHNFIQSEATRLGEPMAAVIRNFIDEKMEIPDAVWKNNPMLEAPVEDEKWQGHQDGALNHDHYVYGTPKKWMKRSGKWVETPPLPEDYHSNPKSRLRYDDEVNRES